jgi:hypothetical protein
MAHDTEYHKKITRKLKSDVAETLRKRFPAAQFTIKNCCCYLNVPVRRDLRIVWRGDEPRTHEVKEALAFISGRQGLRLDFWHHGAATGPAQENA